MKAWFRQIIVSAAPTCTLWLVSESSCYLVFIFWRRWRISEVEILEVKKAGIIAGMKFNWPKNS